MRIFVLMLIAATFVAGSVSCASNIGDGGTTSQSKSTTTSANTTPNPPSYTPSRTASTTTTAGTLSSTKTSSGISTSVTTSTKTSSATRTSTSVTSTADPLFDLMVSGSWLEARASAGAKNTRLSTFTVSKSLYSFFSVFFTIKNVSQTKCDIARDPIWFGIYYDDQYKKDGQLRAAQTPRGDGILGPGDEATIELPWEGSFSAGTHTLMIKVNWDNSTQKPVSLRETNYGNNEMTVVVTLTP